jgi:peptidylprolyl isomerase
MNFKAATTALAAASIGLGVAACGSSTAPGVMLAPSQGATQAPATTATPTTTATTTTTTAALSTPKTGPLSKEPVVTIPKGAPPKKLVIKDLVTGTGTAAADGDELEVNYVGKLYSNGKTFDASWTDTPGKAFGPFELGVGAVIKGWDQGLVGMKVGGRRELIIPPSLAYGAAGSSPTIPKNATLVFVVDLLSVKK